ncbi:MAG: glycosyltransferase family 4 protein [Syntrophobacterales bacterium]|jgi:glycosyltransferase involved in cell wall biosynthesis|nr:glycosyltransferase family 4 protein [Syntrophobacterales bacterium]
MLKVIYTHDIFAFQRFGGISRYFVEIIKRIPLETAKISVFAGLHVNEYLKILSDAQVRGLKVPVFGGGARAYMILNALMYYTRSMVNDLAQRMWLRTDPETVVHLSNYSSSLPRTKVKMVVTAYDMIQELFPQIYPGYRVITQLKKVSFERADRIIAISECTKKDLVRFFGVEESKVTVIHLGNPLEHIIPIEPANIAGAPYILYVGERAGYKNFEALILAYARSSKLKANFELVLFGGGTLTPSERKRFGEMGVAQFVHHTGGEDSLLAGYYRNARAFVWPSLYEGFGIPLLEAMGSRCPVVCSNAGPMPEVVGDAGIYFDPASAEELQGVLETVLFDNTLLEEKMELGLKRAAEFSWDRAARETVDLYRSLVRPS